MGRCLQEVIELAIASVRSKRFSPMGFQQTKKKWHVAHTRPRCEKKLQDFCIGKEISATLPLYRSVRKYRGKTMTFLKPLFSNYLFLELLPEERQTVLQNRYVANLLDVPDQAEFAKQLEEILLAVESDVEICLAPQIAEGKPVRIKSGPLRGVEGIVESRQGNTWVILRLDFISQAAAVKMEATALELV